MFRGPGPVDAAISGIRDLQETPFKKMWSRGPFQTTTTLGLWRAPNRGLSEDTAGVQCHALRSSGTFFI